MRILIAEDDTKLRGQLEQALADHGHEVVMAADGHEAWKTLVAEPDGFDLLLTDIQMPELDGLELIQKMRKENYATPVTIITGHGDLANCIQSLQVGAFDFLVKPFPTADLLLSVGKLEGLQLSRAEKAKALREMSSSSEFRVPSRTALVPGLASHIGAHLSPICDMHRIDVPKLMLCLHEAFMNSVIHGNLEVTSDLREESPALFWDTIREREADSRYADRELVVNCRVDPTRIEVEAIDEGDGFDPGSLPDPNDPESLLASGRGILIIRSFMDEVSWTPPGNAIRMTKQLAC